jgi:cytochrome b561
MAAMNQSNRYGSVSQILHWLTVLLLTVLIVIGKADLVEADLPGSAGFMWHGSLGVLVLALAAARLLWRLVSRPPEFPSTMTRLGRTLARTTHVSLYVLLVALPLSGWLAASSENSNINFFNIATVPRWGPSAPMAAASSAVSPRQAAPQVNGEEREGFSKELHEVLVDALLIVVALHFLAALKHQFIDHDGLMRRMLPIARLKS